MLNVTLNGASGTFLSQNIETINATFVAGTGQNLELDNVSGVRTVGVTGTAAGVVDGFNASTTQPTFAVSNYTRVATLSPNALDGTTANGTAETINVSVSGLSFGTTAATQSGILIDVGGAASNTGAGALETLNLASVGSAANDFSLAFGTNDSVSTLNVTGSQDANIRVTHGAISGVTVNGSANTGNVTLRIDRNGDAATATNAANFTGVDNILLVDGTAGNDSAVLASLQSGQQVTIGSSFAGANSSLAMQGATFTSMRDSAVVTLDHVTANTGVTLAQLDVQNVRTLSLTSAGNAASTSTTGANAITGLTGDFTTITIGGDTSLEIDLNINATQTATTDTARTVVVNASAMTGTAFVNFDDIADSSLVSYNVTGSVNGDIVSFVGSNVANTVDGGAGNDTLSGGNVIDVISGGEGRDLINVSMGADTLTGGAGNDTFDINVAGVTAVPEVQYITPTILGTPGTAGTFVINIGGENIQFAIDGSATLSEFLTSAVTAINASQGASAARWSAAAVDVNADSTPETVAVTFASSLGDVAAPTIRTFAGTAGESANIGGGTNGVTAAVTTNTGGVAARDVNTTITDFAIGDILDVAGLSLGGAYFEGAASAVTAATNFGVIALTGAAYADVAAASAAINHGTMDTGAALVLFLNSTTGRVQAYVDNNLDADAVTGGNDSVVFTFDNLTSLTGLADTFSANSFII